MTELPRFILSSSCKWVRLSFYHEIEPSQHVCNWCSSWNCLDHLQRKACEATNMLLKLVNVGHFYPETDTRSSWNWICMTSDLWLTVDTFGLSSSPESSRAVQRSIAIIRQARQKKQQKQYCMYYNRFGKCNRGTSCTFIHDPDKVAVCTRYTQMPLSILFYFKRAAQKVAWAKKGSPNFLAAVLSASLCSS